MREKGSERERERGGVEEQICGKLRESEVWNEVRRERGETRMG